MERLRTETGFGYVTATYRKAIRAQLKEARSKLLKERYPTEYAEQAGVVKGLTIALACLDQVEGGGE